MVARSMIHAVRLPRLFALWLLAPMVLATLATPAAAQQGADLARRVEKLERDTSVLNQQVFRGQAPSLPPTSTITGASAVAGLEVRVQQLEASVAQATGQMEELSYRMARLQDALNKLTGDVEFRFQELEKAAAANSTTPAPPSTSASANSVAPAPTPPQAVPAARPSTPPVQTLGTMPAAKSATAGTSTDPQQLYNDAFERLRKTDYAGAEVLLQSLIRDYPNHSLLSNAQYWLGETYYARKDYRQAAVAFAQGYQAYPKGNKAADSLLKLGQSLAALNQKSDACLTFDRLLAEYKDISSSMRGVVDRQKERLAC